MAFKCPRWTLANILPIAFVVWIIGSIWLLHVWLHLYPLINDGKEEESNRGVTQAYISQTLTAMMLICLLRAIATDPGSVPETAEWMSKDGFHQAQALDKWSLGGSPLGAEEAPKQEKKLAKKATHEFKQTGERRFCKWCDRYKPDRCHHCRVCRSCILRMDHHCPWIANCVGFRNHKFFFLLVFYAMLNCMYIMLTMVEAVAKVTVMEMHPSRRFLVVFGMTLAVIMGLLLIMFFNLHVYLMLEATTTIEFCEKRFRASGPGSTVSYNVGLLRNFKAVLGPNPLLWLLPCSPPEGEGVFFELAASTIGASSGFTAASSGQALLSDARNPQGRSARPGNLAAIAEDEAGAPAFRGAGAAEGGRAAGPVAQASPDNEFPPEVTGSAGAASKGAAAAASAASGAAASAKPGAR